MGIARKKIDILSGLFLTLLFTTSCSNRSDLFISGIAVQRRVKADAEINLSPSETIASDALFTAKGILAKIDSFLVFSSGSSEYSFLVYNENEDSVVLEFPKKGRGPDEQTVSSITQVRRANGSVEIDILGLNEHSIMTMDFYRSIEKQHVEVIRKTELPPNTTYVHTSDDTVAGIVLFDEYDYSLQLFDVGSMERKGTFLPFSPDANSGFITGTCLMKDDGTKCLWAMQWMDKFNILDLNNADRSASYSTSLETMPDLQLYDHIKDMPPASVTAYYTSARVTDSDIYLLYSGFSIDEADKMTQMEIQNFSWDGRYKNRYIISEIIDSFVVSDDGSAIYGYSWNEYKLYKYNLR